MISSTTAAHNVPVQLNFNNYRSLEAYKKVIASSTPLHMTVVFTQMDDNAMLPQAAKVVAYIQNNEAVTKAASNCQLNFSHFGFIGTSNILVAFYNPSNTEAYKTFINESRRMVRRVANELHGSNAPRNTVNNSEHCSVQGHKAYVMDVRDPIAHITLKYGATVGDLEAVKKALASQSMPAPASLTIRIKDLTAQATKAVQI